MAKDERLTDDEIAILSLLAEHKLDERRIEALVRIADAAEAWGYIKRFLIQTSIAIASITGIVGFILAIRDWLSKGGAN